MIQVSLICAALFLAFSNGANDNFKGLATVWGSKTLSYKKSLLLANLFTVLGAVAAIFFAQELVRTFSGKGLVGANILANPAFATSVAFGASLTVFIATRTGFPVSTTHALLGALTGAAFFFTGGDLHLSKLAYGAAVPLIVSPLLAVSITFLLWNGYKATEKLYKKYFEKIPNCVCEVSQAPATAGFANFYSPVMQYVTCRKETLSVAGVSFSRFCDFVHIASGCTVCFARGVNDTPKIASLLLLGAAFEGETFTALLFIAVAMLAGGIILPKRVAETMSHDITDMDHRQGLIANLTTGFLVLFASKLGLPVSTTHVTVGSLVGIGVVSRRGKVKKIMEIFLAWILILPAAFGIAYFTSLALN